MAVTLDAVTSGGTYQSQSSISWSHTCSGTNRILFVGVQSASGEPTSVYYGEQAMSLGVSESDGNFGNVTMYYLVAPTVGAHNVVVIFPNARNSCAMAMSVNGALNPTYTAKDSNPPSGSTLALIAAEATSNSRDMGVGFVVNGHGTTPLVVNGTVEALGVYDTLSRGIGYRDEEGGAPGRTLTWSVGSTSWTAVQIVAREGDQGLISPSASVSPSISPSLSPSASSSPSSSVSASPSPADPDLDDKGSNSMTQDSVGSDTMTNDNKGSNTITLDEPYYL